MAEALVAIGVVANIVQLVDFGYKVLSRLKQFKPGEIPKAFQQINIELPVLIETLEQIRIAVEKYTLKEDTKKAISVVVTECNTKIRTLDDLLGKATVQTGKSSWRKRTEKVAFSLRQDSTVAKITRDIRNYVQTLTNYRISILSIPAAGEIDIPTTPSSTVPFPRDRDFVHRGILDEIESKCSKPASRVALVGLGGIGKSQLAIEFSYLLRERSPQTWVFWVYASSSARFEDDYRTIAERARLPAWDNPQTNFFRLVNNWLCDDSSGDWLLILDNADDDNIFAASTGNRNENDREEFTKTLASLRGFLPQSQKGSVLVTSRSREVAHSIVGDARDIIMVNPMEEALAMDLLRKRLPETSDEDDAKKLLKAVDFMPLAISQAAAFISQWTPYMTLSKYLHTIEKSSLDRGRLLQKNMADIRRDGRASNSILATWQISYENIRKEKLSAAELLSVMAFFNRQAIPASLLIKHMYYEKGLTEEDFQDDIYLLSSYSLIHVNLDGSEFEMHALVQFSTRSWLELTGELKDRRACFLHIMANEYPDWYQEDWNLFRPLFSHAEEALEHKPVDPEDLKLWAVILRHAAFHAKLMRMYNLAHTMMYQAWDTTQNLLGKEDLDTIACLSNLGTIYFAMWRFSEAAELKVEALKAYRKMRGEEDPRTLAVMNSLVGTYSELGRWQAAEDLAHKTLEIRRRILGDSHPETLISLSNLATLYDRRGRFHEAEVLQSQVLKIRKEQLGSDHPFTTRAKDRLAGTLRSLGRFDESETLLMQVIKTRRTSLGSDHIYTISAMNDLSKTYWLAERLEEAEDIQLQVFSARRKVLGPSHRDTIRSLNDLSWTYMLAKRLEEAEDLGTQALDTSSKMLGNDHRTTLVAKSRLATILSTRNRFDLAENLHLEVLESHGLERNHPVKLFSMGKLADLYYKHARFVECEDLQAQILNITISTRGEDHEDTLFIMYKLAYTLKALNKHQEGLGLLQWCLELIRQKHGQSHSSTKLVASTLNQWLDENQAAFDAGNWQTYDVQD